MDVVSVTFHIYVVILLFHGHSGKTKICLSQSAAFRMCINVPTFCATNIQLQALSLRDTGGCHHAVRSMCTIPVKLFQQGAANVIMCLDPLFRVGLF